MLGAEGKDGDIMKKGKNKFILCASFISFLILANFVLILSVCLEMNKSQNCRSYEILTPGDQNLNLQKETVKSFNLSSCECEKEAQLPEFGYDFDYVVGVVAAESRGEPYEGQVAVAQCILETSEKRMMTPEEVVKMKNRYASPCETQEEKDLVMDSCIDVFIHGEKAFDEPIEYFYSTRGGFVSDWHENNLEYVATIGNHKFFKER